MRKTTTYCDVCGYTVINGYAVEFRWCNEGGYHTFDICKNCRSEAESLVTDKDIAEHKVNNSKDIRFLGFLRLFHKEKKLK
jgi:RNase P subunit RPR2